MRLAGAPHGIPWSPPAPGAAASGLITPKYAAAALDPHLGLMVAALGVPRLGAAWSVSRLTVNFTVAVQALVYVGTAGDVASYVMGTNSGNADTTDNVVPIHVPSGLGLFVVWQSATGTGGARIEYVESAV